MKGECVLKRKNSSAYVLNFSSFICFLVALILIILLRVFNQPEFLSWYGRYIETLARYELYLQTYGSTFVSVVILLVNFALKAFVPWFPVSCICVVSSLLFKWYFALAINFSGLAILYTIKFIKGRRNGAGNTEKLLEKYDKAHNFIDNNESGSSAVLFVLRLIPLMPMNSVSSLYGTTNISYSLYIVISLFGSAYKVISYTIIGRGVFDPASAGFIVPIILLFMFSGTVLLILSGAVSVRTRITVKNRFIKKGRNKNG